MKKIALICYVFISFNSFGQNYNTDASKYTFLEKNYFSQYRVGALLGISPGFEVTPSTRPAYKSAVTMVSIVNIGYNARFNIKDFDDKASIALTAPVDLSLGLGISYPNDYVNTGFLTLASGLFIDFNYGYHSTYNNIDKSGFTVGLGMRVFKTPLFGISEDQDTKFQRLSFGPAVRAELKFDDANDLNRAYYLELGIPSRFDYEGEKYLSNTYVNFGISKILNY